MRTSKRLAATVGGTAIAALLAACANPTQPVASYPSYPANTAAAPGGAVQSAPVAAVEFGRVTDIQTVAMGQTSATNPRVDRAIVGGVIGAVVGNVLGKNVNNGRNRSGATVLGGAAGAAIGSGVGRNEANAANAGGSGATAFRVTVQTDQGAWRTYEVGALGDLRVGDRVRVENGVIYRS